MLTDIARCYADILCLKATLRLPPSPVETVHAPAADCEPDPAAAAPSPAPPHPGLRARALGFLKFARGT